MSSDNSTNSSAGANSIERSYSILLDDILENVLLHSDNPAESTQYIATQIRELIGVRYVMVIEHIQGYEKDECHNAHRLMYMCPERRQEIWDHPHMAKLIRRICEKEKPGFLDPADKKEGCELAALDLGISFFLPLKVGKEKLGSLLLLDLMDIKGVGAILESLGKVSRILALILKNAFLYRDMEAIIAERTNQLAESEEQLRTIYDNASNGLVLLDETARILAVNDTFCKILGRDREDILSLGIEGLATEDPEFLKQRMQAPSDDLPFIFESSMLHADGSLVPMEIKTKKIHLKGQRHFLVTHRDLRETQRIESEVRKEKTFLDLLLEAAPEGIIITDVKGKILRVNREFSRIFGFSAEEIKGCDIDACIAPPEYHHEANELTESVGSGHPLSIEVIRKRKNGTTVAVSLVAVPIVVDEQQIAVYGIYRDITERKKAESALISMSLDLERKVKERTAELEAANRELEAFAYSVSHDLRAPLRSIHGYTHLFLESYRDKVPDEGIHFLSRVQDNSLRMGTLIDDLLSLSRLTRSNLKPSLVDVSALALEVGNEFRQAQPEHDVLFIVQPNVSTVADPALLKIALINLIGNAWKFSSHTKAPKIEVGIEEDTGEFFIKDNGVGFDQKYVDKLFSPFQRLHSAEEFPGTGIGLAIVQRIIRRHGGDIRAHGLPGKGAVFHFSIGTELYDSRNAFKK